MKHPSTNLKRLLWLTECILYKYTYFHYKFILAYITLQLCFPFHKCITVLYSCNIFNLLNVSFVFCCVFGGFLLWDGDSMKHVMTCWNIWTRIYSAHIKNRELHSPKTQKSLSHCTSFCILSLKGLIEFCMNAESGKHTVLEEWDVGVSQFDVHLSEFIPPHEAGWRLLFLVTYSNSRLGFLTSLKGQDLLLVIIKTNMKSWE